MEQLNIIIPYMYHDTDRHNNFIQCLKGIENQVYNDFDIKVTVVEQIHINSYEKENTYVSIYVKDNHSIKHTRLRHDNYFNKSWCINVGIINSLEEHILVLDCDILFDETYLAKVMDFKKSHQFFIAYETIYLMPGRDNPILRIANIKTNRAVGGSWYTTRSFFVNQTGGMNERFYGYGGEDNEMYERVEFVLKSVPVLNYGIIHQYHNWPNKLDKCNITEKHRFINENNKNLFKETKANPALIINKLKTDTMGNKKVPLSGVPPIPESKQNIVVHRKGRGKDLKVLWFYRYTKDYASDHWFHLDYVRDANKCLGINFMAYGPELTKLYKDIVPQNYNIHITLKSLVETYNIDVVILNTKSRMFHYYLPAGYKYNEVNKEIAKDCWLPPDFKEYNIPKIMIEEDYHYEVDDKWYQEVGISLMLQRHYGNFIIGSERNNIKTLWHPLSVNTSIFKPDANITRENIICFSASCSSPDIYQYRCRVLQELQKYNLVTNFARTLINERYVKSLQTHIAHINGCSIYNITSAKMFEIMSSGSVLFTNESDKYGLQELFPEGSYCSYNTNDYHDVKDKATRLIQDTTFRNGIVSLARKCIEDRHTNRIRTEQLLKIIKQEYSL